MAFYAYYSTPLSVDKLNRIEEPTRLFSSRATALLEAIGYAHPTINEISADVIEYKNLFLTNF